MALPDASLKSPYWHPVTKTKAYTLQGNDIKFAVNNNGASGNIVITLPKAGNTNFIGAGGPGLEFMFLVAANHLMTVTPNAGDTIRGKAMNASATNSSVGSLLWLVCIVPGFWEPVTNNGGW